MFRCYTGLAYQEIRELYKKHIIIVVDGNRWIQINRKKTHNWVSIPLLSQVQEVLFNYQSDTERLLPKVSN
ncbi:MAG: hypothetical protein JKY48_10720 [Flavobacteriales bacterium]|nr:hypothetical protein [Flavobacteriales bacterium]